MALPEVTITAVEGEDQRYRHYRMADLQSVLEIDSELRRIYHYDFCHRKAIPSLIETFAKQYPGYEFVDISGKQRHMLAQDPNAKNYQVDENALTAPEDAIRKINQYHREVEFRGLHTHGQGMYKPQPAAGHPAPQPTLEPSANKHRPRG